MGKWCSVGNGTCMLRLCLLLQQATNRLPLRFLSEFSLDGRKVKLRDKFLLSASSPFYICQELGLPLNPELLKCHSITMDSIALQLQQYRMTKKSTVPAAHDHLSLKLF